jgi:dTDP-4-dehydrorhamnose 3,5-epimerase
LKIVDVTSLAFPEVKVIRVGRFADQRGYFMETFRRSDLQSGPDTRFLRGIEFVQANEAYSRSGTIRGLHFQWDPYVGKLIRTLAGHMIDLVLDIRKESPTFGKIIAYDMPAKGQGDDDQWIWVPPGFAHGNFFPVDSKVEYLCSGEYNPQGEAGISPLAADIDWSLCDPNLAEQFRKIASAKPLMSDKDRAAFTVRGWQEDPRSSHFRTVI